eukprot:TRINITY_DN751_c0_g1_i1.p1 TRINITY_DN751_c0_g1~~TRINITY_DN751_c0_g1_i1.p1  ORF type:complete len:665 (-),score=110.04 TRINITY_DN751_c0_g1_i1:225-2219(-)
MMKTTDSIGPLHSKEFPRASLSDPLRQPEFLISERATSTVKQMPALKFMEEVTLVDDVHGSPPLSECFEDTGRLHGHQIVETDQIDDLSCEGGSNLPNLEKQGNSWTDKALLCEENIFLDHFFDVEQQHEVYWLQTQLEEKELMFPEMDFDDVIEKEWLQGNEEEKALTFPEMDLTDSDDDDGEPDYSDYDSDYNPNGAPDGYEGPIDFGKLGVLLSNHNFNVMAGKGDEMQDGDLEPFEEDDDNLFIKQWSLAVGMHAEPSDNIGPDLNCMMADAQVNSFVIQTLAKLAPREPPRSYLDVLVGSNAPCPSLEANGSGNLQRDSEGDTITSSDSSTSAMESPNPNTRAVMDFTIITSLSEETFLQGHHQCPASKPPAEASAEAALAAIKDEYVRRLGPLQFDAVSFRNESTGALGHYYRDSAAGKSAAGAEGDRRRGQRVAREIAALNENLPLSWEASIFVRVDEERPDFVKALIIGPQGTPYADGCFLFDIWLPDDFPEAPPQAYFCTTNGGTVRFNPNLYNCGYVCLSLLGTWSGPSWEPETSTLLQLLVSIQALIFVPEPFFNEPGWEGMIGSAEGTASSREYNRHIRNFTLQHSVLSTLKNPPAVFAEVVNLHYKLKAQMLSWRMDRWLQQNGPRPEGFSMDTIANVARQIKNALIELFS